MASYISSSPTKTSSILRVYDGRATTPPAPLSGSGSGSHPDHPISLLVCAGEETKKRAKVIDGIPCWWPGLTRTDKDPGNGIDNWKDFPSLVSSSRSWHRQTNSTMFRGAACDPVRQELAKAAARPWPLGSPDLYSVPAAASTKIPSISDHDGVQQYGKQIGSILPTGERDCGGVATLGAVPFCQSTSDGSLLMAQSR